MANIKWMLHNVGWNMDALTLISGTVAKGALQNIVSGPRSGYAQMQAAAGLICWIGYDVSNFATTPTKVLEASHLVISRFDWFTNHLYSASELQLKIWQYAQGSYSSLVNLNQVGDTEYALMGPTAQDYVFELNSGAVVVDTRFRIEVNHGLGSTSWGAKLGQFCFCNPWDPGTGPVLNPQPQWTPLGTDAVFQPPRAARHYEVEAEITLSWASITDAKRDELYTYYGGDDCILNWPFYLYDESQTLWNHKLEHVILADYQWAKRGDGYNDLTCKFYRLRHYA